MSFTFKEVPLSAFGFLKSKFSPEVAHELKGWTLVQNDLLNQHNTNVCPPVLLAFFLPNKENNRTLESVTLEK